MPPLPAAVWGEVGRALGAVERLDEKLNHFTDRRAATRLLHDMELRASATLDGVVVPNRDWLAEHLPGGASSSAAWRYREAGRVSARALENGRPLSVSLWGRVDAIMTDGDKEVLAWRVEPTTLRSPSGGPYLDAAPPGAEMREATWLLEEWIGAQKQMSPLVTAILAHCQFARISPFTESAHLARELINSVLVHVGVSHGSVLPIAQWILGEQQAYRAAICGFENDIDYASTITFFSAGIRTAALHQIELLTGLMEITERLIEPFVYKDSLVRLLEQVVFHPVLNNRIIGEICGVAHATAGSLSERLEALQIARVLDSKTAELSNEAPFYGKSLYVPLVLRALGLTLPD